MAASIFQFTGELITVWFNLFLAPLENPTTLWILIPTYLNWVFTEFYQEKHGTSLGNAISNSLIAIWVGWDWLRTIYNDIILAHITFAYQEYIKLGIALVLIAYGFQILFSGIKSKRRAHFIGRIRVVTYVVLMLTPIFYDVVPFSFTTFIAILVFFPVFYFVFEFVDRIIPDSRVLQEDHAAEDITPGEDDLSIGQEPQYPMQQQYYPQQAPPPRMAQMQHPFPPERYYRGYQQVRR